MDEFTYHYKEDKNQLTAVEDTNDNSNPIRFNDLKNQYLGPAVDNYIYNSIGQLEVSLQDEMAYEYNASGLVTKINGFASTSTNDWTSLYENDFSLATDNDVNNWDYEAPNGSSEIPLIRINYINSGIVPVGGEGIECTVVNTRYTSCVSLSMDAALVRGHYRTVPNALHKLDMDVIVQHSQTLGGQVIPAGAIIRVKDANGNVLASQVYNSPNPSLSPDPDMVCGPNPPPRCNDTDCDNFFDEHASFQFTPTTDTIVVEVERDGQWGNIYLDNIHLQVATETKLAFFYNDRGHRIRKESYLSTNAEVTYYVRDVSGSVMAIYTKSGQGQVEQKEIPVYGASRLGVYYTDEKEGGYVYQITDHLGNVRAVVLKDGNNALSLTNRTDYYPFGMPMPNKNIEGDYRYGYQGEYAEEDPETGLNAFQLRMYDSRIGRWISPDPKGEFFSPYLAMANNPVAVTDPDGGCTTKGGRDCVFSVVSGQATDGGGNTWSKDFGSGDLSLLTPFQLNEVIVGDTSGYLAYVNVRGGSNHSFLLDPDTGNYWEASHPVDADGNVTHGFVSWTDVTTPQGVPVGVKSIIRKRNVNDGDFWSFDSGGKKRGNIEVYFVNIPNKAAAIDYADNAATNLIYPYNVTSQNCKHFVIDAMRAGHAKVPNSTALPREFAKPGQSYWFGTTPPDVTISNPNN